MNVRFEVDTLFPGPVTLEENAIMNLWQYDLIVQIQIPGLSGNDKQALKKGFIRYSFLEIGMSVPLAIWIFEFPPPHGLVNVNFNARRIDANMIEWYLDLKDDKTKNVVNFFLLDGYALRAIKLEEIDPKAVSLFQNTIRKQLETNYSQDDYDRALSCLYRFTTDELFLMGKNFSRNKSLFSLSMHKVRKLIA